MDLQEFVSMLSDDELARNEQSIIKALEKRERKEAELLIVKLIDIKTEQAVHPVSQPITALLITLKKFIRLIFFLPDYDNIGLATIPCYVK